MTNTAAVIAQMLFKAGVRLKDSTDLLAMAEANKETRYAIVTKYRQLCGEDLEVTLNYSELANHEHNFFEWVYETTYEQLKNSLYADVDGELWMIQYADKADAWVDDAIDEMQMRRAS